MKSTRFERPICPFEGLTFELCPRARTFLGQKKTKSITGRPGGLSSAWGGHQADRFTHAPYFACLLVGNHLDDLHIDQVACRGLLCRPVGELFHASRSVPAPGTCEITSCSFNLASYIWSGSVSARSQVPHSPRLEPARASPVSKAFLRSFKTFFCDHCASFAEELMFCALVAPSNPA